MGVGSYEKVLVPFIQIICGSAYINNLFMNGNILSEFNW